MVNFQKRLHTLMEKLKHIIGHLKMETGRLNIRMMMEIMCMQKQQIKNIICTMIQRKKPVVMEYIG